jgi:hypothetical protein
MLPGVPRQRALVLLALLLGWALLGQPTGLKAQVAAPQSVQGFDVTLQFSNASPAGGDGGTPCFARLRQDIEQIHFQFILTGAGSPASLTVGPLGFTIPTPASSGTTSLRSEGPDFVFDHLAIQAGVGETLGFDRGRLRLSGPLGDRATRLSVGEVDVQVQLVSPDIVITCEAVAAASGSPDQSSPVVFFVDQCPQQDGQACVLLADGTLTLAFSKLVNLEEVRHHLSATDATGDPVALFPLPDTAANGYALQVQGAWPLGADLLLQVAAGVPDLTGNAAAATQQRYRIVADPGDLDAAGNSSFETGDLSGYSTTAWAQPTWRSPSVASDPDTLARPAPAAESVLSEFHGIHPTEGQWMEAAGSLDTPCGSGGGTALTARFTVPADTSWLTMDVDLLAPQGRNRATSMPVSSGSMVSIAADAGQRRPVQLLSASLQSPTGFQVTGLDWPEGGQVVSLDDQTGHTGWQVLQIPVSGLSGQTVVLTVRLRPVHLGPPPFNDCSPHVVLLDNLRFR